MLRVFDLLLRFRVHAREHKDAAVLGDINVLGGKKT